MKIQTYKVRDVLYQFRREPDGTSTMEVRYKIDVDRWLSEYLDFESATGKTRAGHWWRERSSDPVPKTNQHAVDSAHYHAVSMTEQITVEYYDFGYKRERRNAKYGSGTTTSGERGCTEPATEPERSGYCPDAAD